MAGIKRASDGQASAAKRSKQDVLSRDLLEAMEKDELISHILSLQSQILTTSHQAPPSPPATPGLSLEEVHHKASKARDMMAKGIKSQMKVSLSLPLLCPHLTCSDNSTVETLLQDRRSPILLLRRRSIFSSLSQIIPYWRRLEEKAIAVRSGGFPAYHRHGHLDKYSIWPP